jgi:hypothetical protein
MQLDRHLDRLRDRLALVAGGDDEPEARAAQRLLASLDDSVRLMLLDVLAAAAAEITREVAPGSVELRLRGSDPEFVVSTPSRAPAHEGADRGHAEEASGDVAAADVTAGEGAMARINLRLPEQLKARVEQAAEQEGLSINAWLVRAVGAVVERGRSGAGESDTSRSVQRYTGWGR